MNTQIKESKYGRWLNADTGHSFSDWLGINSPEIEFRTKLGTTQYRMYRNSDDGYSHYRDVEGNWCKTKKAAKASYKEALKGRKELSHE